MAGKPTTPGTVTCKGPRATHCHWLLTGTACLTSTPPRFTNRQGSDGFRMHAMCGTSWLKEAAAAYHNNTHTQKNQADDTGTKKYNEGNERVKEKGGWAGTRKARQARAQRQKDRETETETDRHRHRH